MASDQNRFISVVEFYNWLRILYWAEGGKLLLADLAGNFLHHGNSLGSQTPDVIVALMGRSKEVCGEAYHTLPVVAGSTCLSG